MNSPIFRGFARVISFLFHPLLILTYMICLLMLIYPYRFGINQIGKDRSGLLIIYVFLTTTLIPGIAVSLMKTLGLQPSEDKEDRSNRTGPFIATGIFYLWLYANFNRLPEIPGEFKYAILGSVIALFTAFLINLFSKISLHAVGMGGLVGLIISSMFILKYNNFQIGGEFYSIYIILFVAILLAGIVGSARMVLRHHKPQDLYGGYLLGFFTQFIFAFEFIRLIIDG